LPPHLDTAGRDIGGGIRQRSTAAEVKRGPTVTAQRGQRHHRLRVEVDDGGGVGEAGDPGGGAGHAPHTVVTPTLGGEAVAHGCELMPLLLMLQWLMGMKGWVMKN